MATKKTTAPKTCTYKGETYEILEQSEKRVKLTDGVIHFWVKESDVQARRDN